MRSRYPEQFGMKIPEPKETTRPVAVTGTTRTNGAPAQTRNPRHVVLSESQVRIANSLGISPEDYAKEYVKYEQAAKGGTVQ